MYFYREIIVDANLTKNAMSFAFFYWLLFVIFSVSIVHCLGATFCCVMVAYILHLVAFTLYFAILLQNLSLTLSLTSKHQKKSLMRIFGCLV